MRISDQGLENKLSFFNPHSAFRNYLSCDRFRLQFLRLIVCDEGVDEIIELAFHDEMELVDGEADAMVGDAILFEVVSADFFGAVAGADLRAAFARLKFMLL